VTARKAFFADPASQMLSSVWFLSDLAPKWTHIVEQLKNWQGDEKIKFRRPRGKMLPNSSLLLACDQNDTDSIHWPLRPVT
jgi:hypothetical protein